MQLELDRSEVPPHLLEFFEPAPPAGIDAALKPLDWVDTPGLFAHAMQKAGWYWRADICLIKVNPLPESVSGWKWERCRVKAERRISVTEHEARGHTVPAAWDVGQHTHDRGADIKGRYDQEGQTMVEWADCPGCDKCSKTDGLILRRGNGRPTRAWERFLVFAKAPGAYWDSEAVREPHADPNRGRGTVESGTSHHKGSGDAFREVGISWVPSVRQYHPAGRNLRDWQFWPTTGGVGGLQHYAAFPLGLPSLAIRAGTSERGVCPNCQAPWARVVERRFVPSPGDPAKLAKASIKGLAAENGWGEFPRGTTDSETVGWRPTCACNAGPPVPATVLDPFVGSGTTLIAADRLGRSAIGIDVQPTYINLAAGRARRDAPLFATVEVERQAEQAVVPSDGVPPLPQGPPRNGQTKQERHPDRRVAGFNQRWKATHAPESESGAQLSTEAASKRRDLFSVPDEQMGAETEAAGG